MPIVGEYLSHFRVVNYFAYLAAFSRGTSLIPLHFPFPQPENLLLAEPGSDQVRICDFGNAQELIPDELQYCKYGTPEFVGPEIVSQSPVSGVTDVW